MEKEEIRDGDEMLAIIIRGKDWKEGLNFVSSDQHYQQVGVWGYDKGKLLNAHRHLVAPRTAHRTQEVVYVREGKLRAHIYTEEKKLLTSVNLIAGDTIILLAGGHGYEIMGDGTKVLEVKNGPYVGAEKDRERI